MDNVTKTYVKWEESFNKFENFVLTNKRLPRQKFESEATLYNWYINNRRKYNAGKLEPYKAQKLINLVPAFQDSENKRLSSKLAGQPNALAVYGVEDRVFAELTSLGINSLESLANAYKTPGNLYNKVIKIVPIMFSSSVPAKLACRGSRFRQLYVVLVNELYNKRGVKMDDFILYSLVHKEEKTYYEIMEQAGIKERLQRFIEYKPYALSCMSEEWADLLYELLINGRTRQEAADKRCTTVANITQKLNKACKRLRNSDVEYFLDNPKEAWKLLEPRMELKGSRRLEHYWYLDEAKPVRLKPALNDLRREYGLRNETDSFILGLCHFDLFRTAEIVAIPKLVDCIKRLKSSGVRSRKIAYDIFFNHGENSVKSGDCTEIRDDVFEELEKIVNKAMKSGFDFKTTQKEITAITSIHELGLSARAENALHRVRIDTLAKLESLTEEDLLDIRVLGTKLVQEIMEKREKYYDMHGWKLKTR